MVYTKIGGSRGLALAHRKIGEVLLELGRHEEAWATLKMERMMNPQAKVVG